MSSDEWRAWFESWQLSLEAAGRRPKTVAFYEGVLLRFGEHVGVPPLLVTRTIVREWMRDLIELGRAPNTIANNLICIKSFYSWLVNEGEMPVSPAAGLSPPPHRAPPPDVLSDEEVARVLALLPASSRDPVVRRNRAIVLVFDSSGCRIGEMISMTDAGTDLRNRRIDVEQKGGGWRPVPIDAKAAEAVDRYRRVRGQLKDGDSNALWLGRQGPLTIGGLQHVLNGLGDRADVDLHAHRFRHRFAHRWLDAGGSEAGLQVAAGWASVVMPRRYGRAMAVDRMLSEHERLFRG